MLPAFGRGGVVSVGALICDNTRCLPNAGGRDATRVLGCGLRRPQFSAWCDVLRLVAIEELCLLQATGLGRSLVGLHVFVWASLDLVGIQHDVW